VKGDPNVAVDENRNELSEARELFQSLNRRLFVYADDLVGSDRLKHLDDPNFETYSDEQCRVYPRTAGEGHITNPTAATDSKVGVHTDDQTDRDGALMALNVELCLDQIMFRRATAASPSGWGVTGSPPNTANWSRPMWTPTPVTHARRNCASDPKARMTTWTTSMRR